MSQWVRTPTSILNDPVIDGLASDNYKLWIKLQAVAGLMDGDIPGSSNGRLPNLGELAFHLHMNGKEKILGRQIDALVIAGLLERGGDALHIPNWNTRQRKSDSSNERVSRWREKQARDAHCNVTSQLPETPRASRGDVSPAVSEPLEPPLPERSGHDPPPVSVTPLESEEEIDRESSSSVSAKAAREKDDDESLRKLKEAANGHLALGCANFDPIRALIAEGCDFEADILPFFRDRVTKLASPLRNLAAPWLAAEIRAAARDRKSREGPTSDGPQREPAGHFVSADDPRWAALCARYRKERGSGRPPPSAKNHARPGGAPGWYFEPQWIAALGPAARPAEAAE